MEKEAFAALLLIVLLASLSFAASGTDITALRSQYAAQKTVSERAHQVWLDCLDCYVADRDDCPMCVPLEETDMAEARKLSALEDELRDAEAEEEEKKAAAQIAQPKSASSSGSGVQQSDTSDLSSKSVDELTSIRDQLYYALSDEGLWEEYDDSFFTSKIQQAMAMRMDGLDESLNRIDACYDACSGEKFQRGGGGQACVQPCLDKADAESKRNLQEIDDFEKAAYIEDIARLNAVLAGKTPEVKGELPKGPQKDERTEKGLTPKGKIAPSFGGYRGDAYVQRADGTKVIPGKELYLKVDDKVITGEESKVNIMFGNAGKMYLGPNTELRVGSALLDQYYLNKGTLKTTLEGQKLEIRTPTARVSNKGTDFIVEYNETTNTTTVYLNEGGLDINSSKYSLDLEAGYYCTIDPEGTITSYSMENKEWESLGSRFYEETSDKDIMKVYMWLTFAVLIISAVVAMVFVRREKSKPHKKAGHGRNLGWLSIIFGVIGIIGCLFPIVGFPFSFASTTLARIQKLHDPTVTSRIGQVIGGIGAVLNGLAFIAFFAYTASL